jgi:S-formylglutathione hydrolase FrmB
MKTKKQQAPACFPCVRTTGLLVVLASGLVSILLLRVVAASPGPVPRAPRPEVTKIECSSLSSAILGRSVDYCVALPADYAASNARYPTLYFLHGLFENERSWSERGGQEVLDGLVSQGQVGKFLVVLPDGGKTFYINSFDGHERYEDFFIQELVPAIDRKYRTVPDRQARGISGTSMGGYGALHLSMRHPEVFGTASAQSAALLPKFPNPIPTEGRWGFYARILQGPFGSPLNEAYWEANSPLTLAEHPEHFANLKLYFDCGDNDRYGFEEGAQLLDKILTEKGFRHEYALRPGNHGWSYLSQYMKYALLFHWRYFEQSSAAAAHAGVKSGAH